MLPLRLELEHFASFDEKQVLDFRPFQRFCIVGQNGAGKSSLLEAICWALWGKTKVESDADLIHNGERECSVLFEFSVADTTYRVLRKRKLQGKEGKRSVALLDFLMLSGDEWVNISGATIGETNEAIVKVLGFSYELFVNSVYLRQGRAGEFVQKGASERKALLAELLGLDEYQRMHDYAKQQLRDCDASLAHIAGQLASFESVDLATLHKEHEGLSSALVDAEKQELFVRSSLDELRLQLKVFSEKESEQKSVVGQLQELSDEHDELQLRMQKVKQSHTDLQEILDSSVEVQDGFKRYEKALGVYEVWQEKERMYLSLQEELSRLQASLVSEKASFDAQCSALESEIALFSEELAGKDALLERQLIVVHELEAFEELEKQRATLSVMREEQEEQLLKLAVVEESSELQISELQEKLSLLQGADNACPTCEEHVGKDRLSHVCQKYEKEQGRLSERLAKAVAGRKKAYEEIDRCTKQISELELQLRNELALQREQDEIMARLKHFSVIEERCAQKQDALLRLQKDIQSDASVATEKRIAVLEKEIALLDFNGDALLEKKQAVDTLISYKQLHERLRDSESQFREESLVMDQISQLASSLTEKKGNLEARRTVLAKALEGLESLQNRYSDLEKELSSLVDKRQELSAQHRVLQSELERLSVAEEKNKALSGERDALLREQLLCQRIVEMYSKNGMQAMIIEQMIPEFERLTNVLVDRLTEGRMRISYDLTKQAKNAEKELEAFEIYVHSGSQRRSLSTYSGGEAFRLFFAIRVALAQLQLSFRAARLELLIIDEGFGSQDAQGVELLASCLRSLSDMFQKVIVISHLDTVKEAFDSKIVVTKGSNGSVLEFV